MATLQESAMRLALAALTSTDALLYEDWMIVSGHPAIKALNAALAQQELPQKERPDFMAGYDAGMADAKRMAQQGEPVCAGCGIPAGDVHMSTCKSGKWPSRVSNGDTTAPAPEPQPAQANGRTNPGDETGGAVERFGWQTFLGKSPEIIPATNGSFVWYSDYLKLWQSAQPIGINGITPNRQETRRRIEMTTSNEELRKLAELAISCPTQSRWIDFEKACTANAIALLDQLQVQAERIAMLESLNELAVKQAETLVKQRATLRAELTTTEVLLEECKMDWSGDVAQIKAEHKYVIDQLRAELATIAATEPVSLATDQTDEFGEVIYREVFTRPMPAQDVTELVEALSALVDCITETRGTNADAALIKARDALSKYKGVGDA